MRNGLGQQRGGLAVAGRSARKALPWLLALPAWGLVVITAFTHLRPLSEEQARVMGMVAITATLWGLMRKYATLLLKPHVMYTNGFVDGMGAGAEAARKSPAGTDGDLLQFDGDRATEVRGHAS